MQIKKQDISELTLIKESDLNINKVLMTFSDNVKAVIYIESEKKILQGIITYEDCRRYIDGKGKLVNCNFAWACERNLDIVEDIFYNCKNISHIPVLDENGRILYEYVRVEFLENYYQQNQKQELKFCKLLHKCGIKQIAFVEAIAEDRKIKNITVLPENGINIIFADTYESVMLDNSLVVDRGNLLRIRYKKMQGYRVISGDDFWKMMEGFLETQRNNTWNARSLRNISVFAKMLSKTYGTVAIYNTNSITSEIIAELKKLNKQMIILEKEVVYNLKKDLYEIPTIYKDIDVLVTADFDLMRYRVICDKKDIFNLNYILTGFATTDYTEAYDIDIVNNILPALEKQKCEIVIFETKRIFETDRINLANFFENAGFVRYRDIFEMDDCYLKIPYGYDNGYLDFIDYQSDNYNILNGMRRVTGCRGDAQRNIYLFGYCDFFGMFVKDSATSASFLQEMLIGRYNVYNFASANMVMQWKLRIPQFREGDIIVLETLEPEIYQNAGYPVNQLYKDFILDEFKDCFRDVSWDMLNHGNTRVMKRIAESVYMDLNKFLK